MCGLMHGQAEQEADVGCEYFSNWRVHRSLQGLGYRKDIVKDGFGKNQIGRGPRSGRMVSGHKGG